MGPGIVQQYRFELALRAVLCGGLGTELGHAGEDGVDVYGLSLLGALERWFQDHG